MKTPATPLLVVMALVCLAFVGPAEAAPLELLHTKWPAIWISCPNATPRGTGIYHFRKHISIGEVPARYVVHVSADNRFVLFVNGARVGDGPARGDLAHWRYETFDLASLLHPGDNLIAATVWNYGAIAPMAQVSDQTGFLLQADDSAESAANTGETWEAKAEVGRSFLPIVFSDVPSYYASTPGETVDGERYDWDWQTSLSGWQKAVPVGGGEPGRYPDATPAGTGSGINPWLLVADPLPHMEYTDTEAGSIVRSEGLGATALPVTVPAHARASLLFDRGSMTTGYPEIEMDGGRGAKLRVTYAEALFDAKGAKGNRNEIEGRHIVGLNDRIVGGGSRRTWTPLYWRAWRYLQIDIEASDEPMTLRSLKVHFSGYPFTEKGRVEASDPTLQRMWEVGTRTARMNAHETYMDCPYWEQLQYLGDTRIEALISYIDFGDDRLARQALNAFDYSRINEGLTCGRYPAAITQVISTFSLYWVGMIHDYWLYRPDAEPLRTWVPHSRTVIDWYARHQRADGLLGALEWWNFADWTKDFDFGVPPQDADGGSCLLSLTFMGALRDAADLEEAVGNPALAADYRRRADRIGAAAWKLCWDESRGLLADTPAHRHYSEHTNALGVLLDVIPAARQKAVMQAVIEHRQAGPGQRADGEFSPASLYYRFYVARALDHAGMADLYLTTLGPWRRMLDLGLSTWAETADPTRSDDHAWSAHPNYDFVTLVGGISPASPGFRTVRVAPHPGALTAFKASIPHPSGELKVDYSKSEAGWIFHVDLPPGVTGNFLWDGKTTALAAGPNTIDARR